MIITRTITPPSRPDAERLKRSEKAAMLCLMNAVTTLDNLQTDLKDRLDMVEGGHERLRKLTEDADELLTDLRVTAPEDQRVSMENIGKDFESRLVPKMAPSDTSMLVARDDYKLLVDSARVRCKECTEDDVSCQKCDLYKLPTCVLPLDNYHSILLCPYNLAGWKN